MANVGLMAMTVWSLYLVRCADRSLYTGITTDVQTRFQQHSEGGPKAAKYLRGKGPLELAYFTEVGNRAQASSLEWRIKRLPKSQKERLVIEGLSSVLSEGLSNCG